LLPLLLALAVAGCGSGKPAAPPIPTIELKSAAISGPIPVKYTCDGQDISPPLEWGSVPARTSELVLVLVSFTPVSSTRYSVNEVNWAVAGINPQLHRLAAGQLPRGTHVGRANSGTHRYSICPGHGKTEDYQFELYALPESVKVPAKFVNLGAFYVFTTTHQNPVIGHGVFAAKYTRPSKS